jgi:hypothetical protein
LGDNAGFSPRYIAPGNDAGEFLLTSEQSYNRGFTALKLGFDDKGHISVAKTKATTQLMTARDNEFIYGTSFKHRLNIQRAAGTAIVMFEGKEYAFVADFNLPFNDAWSTGESGIKQIGGKIGIIQDPFGDKPRYLGATTPMAGVMLDHLVLTDWLMNTTWV